MHYIDFLINHSQTDPLKIFQTVRTFTSFEDIAAEYESGELSEEDLKKVLTKKKKKIRRKL